MSEEAQTKGKINLFTRNGRKREMNVGLTFNKYPYLAFSRKNLVEMCVTNRENIKAVFSQQTVILMVFRKIYLSICGARQRCITFLLCYAGIFW